MRYEIKDIIPPTQISKVMDLQAEAERVKRSKILESEGVRQSLINQAEGEKQSQILEGKGMATKTLNEAKAICESLNQVSDSIRGDPELVSLKLKLTEKYLEQYENILSKSRLIVLPSGKSEESNTLFKQIASAAAVFNGVPKS